MQFKSPSPRPTPLGNPRDRRRLLGLLFFMGLVIIGFVQASDPQNWYWLTGKPAEPAGAKNPRAKTEVVEPYDQGDDPLPPDTFRLMPSSPAPGDADPDAANSDSGAGSKSTPQQPAERSFPDSYDLRISPALLAMIRDSSVGIRRDESDAYYTMLAKVRDVPLSVLERAASRDVQFTEVFNDPEDYRGRLLTLSGEVRRLTPMAAGENEQGLVQLYDAWMFTDDGGPKNPFRIVCTEVPAGMPTGEAIRQRVRVTGYFFKRCGYLTAHGLHSAPMLLAKRFRWSPPQHASSPEKTYTTYLAIIMAVAGSGFAAVTWWYAQHEKRRHAVQVQRALEPSSEALAALQHVETTNLNTLFQHLDAQPSPGDNPTLSPDTADADASADHTSEDDTADQHSETADADADADAERDPSADR